MYRDMPADERQHWLNLLSIEGEIAEAWRGLSPGDIVNLMDD